MPPKTTKKKKNLIRNHTLFPPQEFLKCSSSCVGKHPTVLRGHRAPAADPWPPCWREKEKGEIPSRVLLSFTLEKSWITAYRQVVTPGLWIMQSFSSHIIPFHIPIECANSILENCQLLLGFVALAQCIFVWYPFLWNWHGIWLVDHLLILQVRSASAGNISAPSCAAGSDLHVSFRYPWSQWGVRLHELQTLTCAGISFQPLSWKSS